MDLLRSLPLGLYLEQPITCIGSTRGNDLADELPGSSDSGKFRLACSAGGAEILVTLTAAIPLRVWRQQMGWLLMLSFLCCSKSHQP